MIITSVGNLWFAWRTKFLSQIRCIGFFPLTTLVNPVTYLIFSLKCCINQSIELQAWGSWLMSIRCILFSLLLIAAINSFEKSLIAFHRCHCCWIILIIWPTSHWISSIQVYVPNTVTVWLLPIVLSFCAPHQFRCLTFHLRRIGCVFDDTWNNQIDIVLGAFESDHINTVQIIVFINK